MNKMIEIANFEKGAKITPANFKARKSEVHPVETVLNPMYDDHVSVFSRSATPEKSMPEKREEAEEIDDDVEWLVKNSMETVNMLEYVSHGTIDLALDVPDLIGDAGFTCERFLSGTHYNRAKSRKNLEEYVLWRSNSQTIEEVHITQSLAAQKVFLLEKEDKSGGPVVVVVARNHDMYKTPIEETIKLLTYSLDKAIERMDKCKGVTKTTVVLDLTGVGMRSLDVNALKTIMFFFQNLYPERVSTAVFLKAPTIFLGIWRLVVPFVSDKVKNSILFARTAEDLQPKIDLNNLPESLGGYADNKTMVPINYA